MLPGNTQVAKEMLKVPEKQEAQLAPEVIAAHGRKSFRIAVDVFPGPAHGCCEESRGLCIEDTPVLCFDDELHSGRIFGTTDDETITNSMK